jgi:hypothetical protein
VQRRSGKCNVAQKGAAWPSEKIYAPDGPSSVQKGSILFLEFIFGEAAMAGGGAQHPVWQVNEPKRGVRAAHTRPEPTSNDMFISLQGTPCPDTNIM